MEQRKIIMDCDPGIDDAMALAYAASRPDAFKILAVTTVAGNQELQKVTANALDLTAFYGLDTEVAAGMSQPLINKLHRLRIITERMDWEIVFCLGLRNRQWKKWLYFI